MTQINDVFYGENTSNLLLRKSWLPSSGSYPTDTTEGFVYVAEDTGIVATITYSPGDAILYKDGGWVPLSKGGIGGYEVITGATTLLPNSKYILDFNGGAFDVTLPDSPQEGDEIVLAHIRGDVEALSPAFPQIVQATTDENIAGLDENMDIDTNYELTRLVFSDIAGIGWRVY